jgi:hypothetical protein
MGPVTYYEGYVFLLAVASLGVLKLKRWVPLALILILALNVSKFVQATEFYRHQVGERMDLFNLVQKSGIQNAVVFLRTGSGSTSPSELARNGLDFNGPVLLVDELGPQEDAKLIASLPGRAFYVYTYDFFKLQGRLEPYDEKLVEPWAKTYAETHRPVSGPEPSHLE